MSKGRLEAFSDGVLAIVITIMVLELYTLLVRALIAAPGQWPTLAEALADNRKGLLSIALYVAALAVSLVAPLVAIFLDAVVSAIWIIPDRRIERRLAEPH